METKSIAASSINVGGTSSTSTSIHADYNDCRSCDKWVKNWMHKADHKTVDVYVGRKNPSLPTTLLGCDGRYGNPFPVVKTAKPGQPGSREDVVDQFAQMLYYDQTDKAINLRLAVVKNLSNKTLACWCAPALCHAKVLAHFVNCTQHIPIIIASTSTITIAPAPAPSTAPLQKSGVRKIEVVNPFVMRKKSKLSNESSSGTAASASVSKE